jgi:hypothetical protein
MPWGLHRILVRFKKTAHQESLGRPLVFWLESVRRQLLGAASSGGLPRRVELRCLKNAFAVLRRWLKPWTGVDSPVRDGRPRDIG